MRGVGSMRIGAAVAIAAILVAGCVAYWFVNRARSTDVTEPAPAAEPAPPADPLRNAGYVGSQACAECHGDKSESYAHTGHGHSFSGIDISVEPPDGEYHHAASGRSYRVYRDNTELHHRELLQSAEGEELVLADHALRYVVGSGSHARTYLIESNGFLAESPLTWYASRKQWAISPGFEQYNTGFARPVYFDCLFCHTGRVESIGGSRSQLTVRSERIDCERCHGPGSLHVEKWNANEETSTGSDPTIVNPSRLSREKHEAICAQCHLHGDAVVDVAGRKVDDFRPGMSLADFRVNFAVQRSDNSMTVVGHVEQLRLSRCYQSSETMTCSTCHDPHVRLGENERIESYRAKCLACHSKQGCGLAEPQRLEKSAGDDCAACHMPTSPTDVPHVAATHHRIAVHTHSVALPTGPDSGIVVPLDDISHLPQIEQDRCLGLAYLSISLQNSDPMVSERYRQRAKEILEGVRSRGLQDAELDVGLAQIYLPENPQRSVELTTSVLNGDAISPETQVKALFVLSQSCLRLNLPDRAIEPLEQLVRLRRQAGDWYLLSVCRYQAGKLNEALIAAHRAADIMPDRPHMQQLLAELYQKTGSADLASKHQKRAEDLAKAQESK